MHIVQPSLPKGYGYFWKLFEYIIKTGAQTPVWAKKTPEVPLLPEKTLKLPKIKTTTYKTYEKATSRRFVSLFLKFLFICVYC